MKRRINYFSIDNDYIKSYAKHLGVVATAVYTSLCMHSNYNTKQCWPSMETIAKEHGLERHAVSRALIKLEEYDLICVKRAIDRNNKKRKNNVYLLLSREVWRKLPTKEETHGTTNSTASHGIESTALMVSKTPQSGIQNASNKTNITKLIEEQNTNCGQEPTVCVLSNQPERKKDGYKNSPIAELETVVWDCNEEIINLANSNYPDYRIIGLYFNRKRWFFDSEQKFNEAFKRELKPANLLREYKLNDIVEVMDYCEETYAGRTGWTLETVIKRIDDYLANGFFPSNTY